MDAVCEHLEAVSRGELRNLVITVPPRSSKSTITSVLWPAWSWIARSSMRWLTASYALALAVRDAVRSRRVLDSPWYRARWADRFRLTGDANLKSRYENDRTGLRMAVSVNGAVTGEGGDVLLIDDAHNVKEAESVAVRRATLRWWNEAFSNRLNDARAGARVIIGQRVHTDDVIGHVLGQGGFEELRIPEEFEADRPCVTAVGWADPRTEEGELMRPERFGPVQVEEAKKRLGSVGYAAQHQQRPTPREGALFKEQWWRYYAAGPDYYRLQPSGDVVPHDHCLKFAVMDPAGGVSAGADYTAIGFFAVTPKNDLFVLHMVREQIPVEEIVRRLKRECARMRPEYVCIEGGFLQSAHVRAARKEWGMPAVREVDPGGKSKLVRATPAVIRCEAGQIYLPESAPWLDDFLAELRVFTGVNDAHDDQVDVLAYAALQVEAGGEGMDMGQMLFTFSGGPGARPPWMR
jgi:predicted phage terminase large subunit-like protein